MTTPHGDAIFQRILGLDLIKAVAIIGVVYIHSSEPVINSLHISPSQTSWLIVTFINALWRWSVPALIMVSGALALDPARSSRPQYIRKRLIRLSIALFAGLCLQSIASWITTGSVISLGQLANFLIFDQPYGYLYFLCILLLLTPITPWLSRQLNKLNHRQTQLVTVAGLLLTVTTFGLSRFFLMLIPTYVGFYIAGLTLLHCKLVRKIHILLSLVAMISIAGITTYALYLEKGLGFINPTMQQYVTFMNNASPGVIVLSILAFILLLSPFVSRRIKKRSNIASGISLIAQYSLGIYLLHAPIMQLTRYWVPQIELLYTIIPLVATVCMAIFVTLVSLGLAMLLAQNKISKQFVR